MMMIFDDRFDRTGEICFDMEITVMTYLLASSVTVRYGIAYLRGTSQWNLSQTANSLHILNDTANLMRSHNICVAPATDQRQRGVTDLDKYYY